MSSVTPNCTLLPYDVKKEGALMLREFRTQDRRNPVLYIRRLGLGLSDETTAVALIEKVVSDFGSLTNIAKQSNTFHMMGHKSVEQAETLVLESTAKTVM